jgi:hypothetical protein
MPSQRGALLRTGSVFFGLCLSKGKILPSLEENSRNPFYSVAKLQDLKLLSVIMTNIITTTITLYVCHSAR